ncbi:hypothetical protein ACF0H5_021131 [Mactra antiquata]
MKENDEGLGHEKNETKGPDKGDTEEPDEEITIRHPRDHGYSWIILIGGIFEMSLLIGILKSSGLLFVAFQEKFKSSSSMTSLPSTVQNICFSVMAIFVMNIGLKLTTSRNLVMFGSVLMCISYVVTSQAQDIRVLLFSHGILHGIASAFMQPTTVVTVSQYFDKRRGFANSLAVSGSCVGGLVFAPLITNLLSSYGYSGCLLIIAGILLNGCVCGALFRPISFYDKRQTKKNEEDESNNAVVCPEKQNLIKEVFKNGKTVSTVPNDSKDEIIIERFGFESKLISSTRSLNGKLDIDYDVMRPRARTFIDHRDRAGNQLVLDNKILHYSSKDFISSSILDIPTFVVPSTNINNNKQEKNITEKTDVEGDVGSDVNKKKQDDNDVSLFRAFWNLFDFTVFKQPVFITFLSSAACICPSTVMVTIYMAPHAKDLGVSTKSVADLVLVYTSVDLVARITLGYVSDKGWLRRSTLVGITTMIVSLSAHLVRFYTDFSLLIVFAVILGLVSGLYFSIYPVVLTDYMSIDKLRACLGFTALVHGFCVATTFFLVGYLRDISGSYIVPYHFIGTQSFIGGCIMLLLPLVERYSKSKHEKKAST